VTPFVVNLVRRPGFDGGRLTVEDVTEPQMNQIANGPESIGERLRRLRLERQLSQRELASPGVSYAYISRIEAGARRPSVKALRQLARKLGVSVEYLETGSDLRDVDERELRLSDAELELRLGHATEETERVLNGIFDEAVAAGDTKGALRAGVALGLAAASAGRSADAINRLEPAVQSLSPVHRPDVYEALGRCYAALGDTRRAVDLFENSLGTVRQEAPDDTASQIRFSTYLSYALADVGDLEHASSVLEDALGRADEMTDAYTRVRLYWSLARLSALQDQPAAALDYIRRAIALLEVTEDTLHLARAHLLCGTIMMSQGKAEEAGSQFDAAERLFGPRPEPLDLANLRTDQAKRAAMLGRAAEAESQAREAIAALRDEHPNEQGLAWAALADALALQEKHEADETFRKAADLLQEHGHQVSLTETFRSWARYLRKAGRESEALDILDRAAQLNASTRSQSLT
jgi:tetratricopeptide (TPR) repeat protein